MNPELLERYADLIVSVGANVQPDQVLAVEALLEAQPLVHAIARRAYEKGARYVDVQYFDGAVKRIRAETAREETLDWVPPWLGRRMELLGELDAARCVLVPLVPPGLLDGVDPARAGLDRLPTIKETFKTIDERSIAWTLSPFPTRALGADGLPGARRRPRRSSSCGATSSHVCRLDEPDPARGLVRADRGDLQGGGTPRRARPRRAPFRRARHGSHGRAPAVSRFAKEGGSSQTRTGVRHVPNIPTEEVYTTPDPERTSGVVTATKPLDVAGSLVTGLRIRFEGGRAVEIDADANAEALRAALRGRRGRVTARRGRARRP